MAASWRFVSRWYAREAKMGLIEISVILACASAFGFYITAGDH